MKCTNCGLETNKEDDLHCRDIFEQKMEELLSQNMNEEAWKLYKETKFENPFTSIWKYNNWRDLREEMTDFEQEIEKKEKELQRQQRESHRIELENIKKAEGEKLYREKQRQDEIEFNKRQEEINRIIIAINNKERISDQDIQWLEGNKLYNVLGDYYYNLYLKYKDLWDLSKASSNYRRQGNYNKAIAITDNLSGLQWGEALSAVLTSRGGAFKDLRDLSKAKQCAYQALEKHISFYPYKLLGSVSILKDDLSQAEFFFDKAIELGAANKSIDSEISNTIKKLSGEEQKRLREYFLQKYK